ncbi:MAG: EutN/CcmL family microcompartment protein [Planctomycetaceae bacterium]|nr:EutN/CcmL family microcompartment protein [Planctomycetaceae bacterium]
MLNALVIGNATSTLKHESMTGRKLLIVQPLGPGNRGADGDPVLTVDTFGAGIGDYVMISSDGKYTAGIIGQRATPVRWSVVGIIDSAKSRTQSAE